MTMPLWLEIAIGILVGIIFIAILSFIISALVYILAGDHIQRSAYMGWRKFKPQVREVMTGSSR